MGTNGFDGYRSGQDRFGRNDEYGQGQQGRDPYRDSHERDRDSYDSRSLGGHRSERFGSYGDNEGSQHSTDRSSGGYGRAQQDWDNPSRSRNQGYGGGNQDYRGRDPYLQGDYRGQSQNQYDDTQSGAGYGQRGNLYNNPGASRQQSPSRYDGGSSSWGRGDDDRGQQSYGGTGSRNSGYGQQSYGGQPSYGSQQSYGSGNSGGQYGSSSYGSSGGSQSFGQSGGQHRGKGPKGYSRSDTRIQDELSDRLMDDGDVDASDIQVSVKGGEVTLSGTVESRHCKMKAEEIAESCLGVTEVVNQIRVKRSSEVGGDKTDKSGTGSSGSSSYTGSSTGSTSTSGSSSNKNSLSGSGSSR